MKLNLITNGDFQGESSTYVLTGGGNATGNAVPAGTVFTTEASTVSVSFTQPAVDAQVTATCASSPITAGFVVGQGVYIASTPTNSKYAIISLTSSTMVLELLIAGTSQPEGTVFVTTPLLALPFTFTASAAFIQPAVDSNVTIDSTNAHTAGVVGGQNFTIPDGNGTDSYTLVSFTSTTATLELTANNFAAPDGTSTNQENVALSTGWTLYANTGALTSTTAGNLPTLTMNIQDPKTFSTSIGGTIIPQVPGEFAFTITPANTDPINLVVSDSNFISINQSISNGPKAVAGKSCNLSFWVCAKNPGFFSVYVTSLVNGNSVILVEQRVQIFNSGEWQFFQVPFTGFVYPYTDVSDTLNLGIIFDNGLDTFIGQSQAVGITGISISAPISEDIFDDALRLFQNIPIATPSGD